MSSPASPLVPPPTVIPAAPVAPADIAVLDPLTHTWAAGTPFRRIYDVNWGSRDFYAGDAAHRARFSPFVPVGHTAPLPVLYGADDDLGALSESIFHDVPVRGVKHVPYAKLIHRQLTGLTSGRDLKLIDLTSAGLARLGLSRHELIESDPRSYPGTAEWGRALHDHPVNADGLYWVSRQHDTSTCLVIFGDRLATSDLTVAPVPSLALAIGAGLDLVCQAADRMLITITGIPSA